MSLLVCLAAGRGRVLSKDEIIEQVWEGRIVSDEALSVAVHSLRRALGDSARNSRYIETIPGRGYRWAEPVTRAGEEADEAPLAREDTAIRVAGGELWRRPGVVAAGFGLALIVLVVGVVLARSRSSRTEAIETLAVLSLRDVSATASATGSATGRPQPSTLAGGMTDTLIMTLERSLPVRVLSRLSVLRAERASDRPAADFGRNLGADALISGTVAQSQGRVRIELEIRSARSGALFGRESVDGAVEETFALQSTLARRIAARLSDRGMAVEPRLATATGRRVSPEALDAYFEAVALLEADGPQARLKAREKLLRAVRLEPSLVEAHDLLAEIALWRATFVEGAPRSALDAARASARTALAIDPGSPNALTVLAMVEMLLDWDLRGAEQRFQRTIQIAPNFVRPHQYYAWLLTAQGRFAEAEAHAREAMALQPLEVERTLDLAWVLLSAGQPTRVLAEVERAEARGLSPPAAALYRSHAFYLLGDEQQACRWLETAVRLAHGPGPAQQLADTLNSSGSTGYYRRYLEQRGAQIGTLDRARFLIRAGAPDAAWALVDGWVRERHPGLIWAANDPDLRRLGGEPSWHELFGRLRAVVRASAPAAEPDERSRSASLLPQHLAER
jgi:TolB-like protein/Flp pilus assembly protein TadD